MNETIAKKLGIIPDRDGNSTFDTWFHHYSTDLQNIFNIFLNVLQDVYPFCNTPFETNDMFKKFALFLYKSSSKILK